MTITTMLRRLIGRGPDRSVPRTPEDLISFKSGAWKSRAAASTYSKVVEHDFFDSVTAPLFVENMPPNAYVLDVGAGTGRLSFALAEAGHRVVAADISAEMLRQVDLHKAGRAVQTLEAPAASIPVPAESFDAVVSMDVLLHFPNWRELVREKARVCKRGGTIMFNILSADNLEFLRANQAVEGKHTNFFANDYGTFVSEEDLHGLAAANGLVVERIYPYDFFCWNSMFGCKLTKPELEAFYRDFIDAIKDEGVKRFVKMFEERIVRHMPLVASVTMIVKLRKL